MKIILKREESILQEKVQEFDLLEKEYQKKIELLGKTNGHRDSDELKLKVNK